MTDSIYTYDETKALTANAFSRTGYTFSGWNTNSSGTGTSYSNSQSVSNLTSTNGAIVNLYAKWTPITYQVKYNANGGTGSMSNSSHTYNVAKNLTANAFSRSGYAFNGWNTKADGTGTSYSNSQSVTNLSSTNGAVVNLYAKWKDTAAPTVSINTQFTNPSEVVNTNMPNNYTNAIPNGDGTLKYGVLKAQTFAILITTTDNSTISSIEWKVSTNNVTVNATNYNNLGNVKLTGSASNKSSGTQTTSFTGKTLSSSGWHYIYAKATDAAENVGFAKVSMYVYTDREKFVMLCYNNVLGRVPDYTGFSSHNNTIANILNGGTPTQYNYTGTTDTKIKAIVDTLWGFYGSNEYITWWNSHSDSERVKTLYWGALRRTPGTSEISGWAGKTLNELFSGIALSQEAMNKFANYSLNAN